MSQIRRQSPLLRDQVREKIRALILEQRLEIGDRLPPETQLASMLAVNHQTVRAALGQLADDGVIVRKRGSGSYLSRSLRPPERENRTVAILNIGERHLHAAFTSGLCRELQRARYVPSTLVVNSPQALADAVACLASLCAEGCHRLLASVAILRMCEEWQLPLPELPPPTSTEINPKVIWFASGKYTLPPGIRGGMVASDSETGLDLAVKHLCDNGHSRITYITHPLSAEDSQRRYGGWYGAAAFERSMARYGCADGAAVLEMASDMPAYRQQLTEHLTAPGRPTAIIGSQDTRAVPVLEVAHMLSYEVPTDLAVIGYFNTPWAEQYDLTSVDPRVEEMAQAVISMLDDPAPSDGRAMFVTPTLSLRGSTVA